MSGLMRTLRGALSVVVAVVAVMAALVTPAGAQTDVPGEIGVQNAFQCRDSVPGPGNWNKTCMDVYGYSVRVDKVEVRLTSTVVPYFPVDVCNVTFEVWGRKAGSGVHWQQSANNPNCGRGSLGMIFYPGEHFENGSYFCSRTIWSGMGSEPNCIIIKV